MEPASTIIERLGGTGKVAAIAGVHRTRVWNWTRSRGEGGTGGLIPQKHHKPLLLHARYNGIKLEPADFAEPLEAAE